MSNLSLYVIEKVIVHISIYIKIIMKKIILLCLCFFTLITPSFAADIEDNQIIEKLDSENTKELEIDFTLKKFNSCENMEEVMWDYIKNYWEKNQNQYRGWPVFFWGITEGLAVDFLQDSDAEIQSAPVSAKSNTISADSESASSGGSEDFSKTNTQVDGVDESDIIKTDGENTYYYNATQRAVFIITDLEVQKKINLPKSFYWAELYIWDDILTIISTGYSQTDYSSKGYFINRNTKTYTMVFDVSDVSKPKLNKLYVNDGNYSKSRKIGDYIYVLSNNYFNIPYYNFNSEDDISIRANKIVPRKVEISRTDELAEQNLTLQWEDLPYNISGGQVTRCEDIEYLLPDEETIEKYSFNPSYNIISIINIADTSEDVMTKSIAGSNNEIYMSLENMYLTSNMYTAYDFTCPIWKWCFLPFYHRWENTLIHKLNIDENTLEYDTSTIVSGKPLTQYSMDENKWYFRILTQHWYPERSTSLYVLDEDLELAGSLTDLWKTEDFKSSRFIGDKLFLVTFEQIDPFFAIDVADPTDPKVLWELKIPGFSTYLHPYDENHIIWLGQATTDPSSGRTTTDWLKVDLYEINYDKKCWDDNLNEEEIEKCESGDYKWIIVKQSHTLTMGGRWSYSEALNNPRMFIWNQAKQLLLLPVQLYENEDPADEYRRTDFFQGLSLISIDKDAGINETGRISHIDTSNLEEERTKECSKFSQSEAPVCKELIWWGEYCGASRNTYVPPYCFADSDIWEYIAAKSWNYQTSFVKRALYIGDSVISVSDEKLQTNNIDSLERTGSVEMK